MLLFFFLKFHFLLCEELQHNKDQLLSDYVNVNQLEKNTAKFHVIWRNAYLGEVTTPDFLFNKI